LPLLLFEVEEAVRMLYRWTNLLLLWAHCSVAFQPSVRRFHRCPERTCASYDDAIGSESGMPPEGAAYWESMSESASLKGPATLSFDFLLPEGWAARVDLWSEEDAGPAAAKILAEYSDSSATLEELTLALQSHWARAVGLKRRCSRECATSFRYPVQPYGYLHFAFTFYSRVLDVVYMYGEKRCQLCFLGLRLTSPQTARQLLGKRVWWQA